jgi:glucose/arabinose dehydrogenase
VWFVRRRSAAPVQVVAGLESALGLAWHRGWLYVAHISAAGGGGLAGRVTAYRGFDGRRFARSRVVVDGLPVGRHRIDSIAPGPGGRLYLGIGSEFDNRASSARLSSTVVSFRPSGRGLRIEATGLRNPYGLAFIPGTSQLLVSEHGRDDLGLRSPNEEVNAFDVDGRVPDFGFPACFGQGGSACRGTRAPLVNLPPHAAPGAIAVVKRSATAATAYVPQFGSSFDANPTGGDVVAIRLTRKSGRWHASRRTLAAGLGRQNPLGAAIGPDGDLYVSLWSAGRIVRFDLPRQRRIAAAQRSRGTVSARPAAAGRDGASASPAAPRPAGATGTSLAAPLGAFLRRLGWVLGRVAA